MKRALSFYVCTFCLNLIEINIALDIYGFTYFIHLLLLLFLMHFSNRLYSSRELNK